MLVCSLIGRDHFYRNNQLRLHLNGQGTFVAIEAIPFQKSREIGNLEDDPEVDLGEHHIHSLHLKDPDSHLEDPDNHLVDLDSHLDSHLVDLDNPPEGVLADILAVRGEEPYR